MSLRSDIKWSNRILADYRRTPQGDPMFKWILSTELLRPVKVGTETVPTGILGANGQPIVRAGVPKFEMRPQVPLTSTGGVPVWVLAKWFWTSEADWQRAIGDQLPWPKNGRFINVMWMPPGKHPRPEFTIEIVQCLRQAESQTIEEQMYEYERERQRDIDSWGSEARDRIEDAIPAFANIPGSRGLNVSFPSVTKKETVQ